MELLSYVISAFTVSETYFLTYELWMWHSGQSVWLHNLSTQAHGTATYHR